MSSELELSFKAEPYKVVDYTNINTGMETVPYQPFNPSNGPSSPNSPNTPSLIEVEISQTELNAKLCEIVYFDENAIEKFLISLVLMLMGIEHAFLGYKHFRQTMFLSGAMFAFTASYFAILNKTFGTIVMTPQASLGVAGCCQLWLDYTSMVDLCLGYFLTGVFI